MKPMQVIVALIILVVGLLIHVQALDLSRLLPFLGINFKPGALEILDKSNDVAADFNTHQLIERAGFQFENYYAMADDGYITQLVRVINPLADASYLKQPPIMIQHGQTANSKNFIMQSNKQHHPMAYPRRRGHTFHGLFSRHEKQSSNRSLAFMLANNGYDVWLTSTRGVDENNRGYLKEMPYTSIRLGKNLSKNMSSGEEELLIERSRASYWSFTLDDQIAHELPSQIDLVLQVTGASKVTIFGYSNTALTTFALLSIRPDIATYVDTFIAVAPVVYYSRLSGWFKWFMHEFLQIIPQTMDTDMFVNDKVSEFLRRVVTRTCSSFAIRYTVCKFALDLVFGDSSQFRTLLELPFFSHMIRSTSWKCLAQHLQIVKSHRLAKFDYGPELNHRYYGSSQPPEYNLSDIDPNLRIALVSGEKDNWANQDTVNEIRAKLHMKPVLDLVLPDFNHLDLTAARDVDVKVNLPLLRLLDERHSVLAASPKPFSDTYTSNLNINNEHTLENEN